MARQLKPQKVETLRHILYGEVELFLDRNDLHFFATIAGVKIDARSIDDLMKEVRAELDRMDDLEWVPVIKVDKPYDHSGQKNRAIAFQFKRFYVAKVPHGGYRESGWEVRWPHEKADSRTKHSSIFYWNEEKSGPFAPPCNPFYEHTYKPEVNASVIYLPYSDETWLALEQLAALVATLKERLESLLFIPAQSVNLAQAVSGIKLLGMGGQESDEA